MSRRDGGGVAVSTATESQRKGSTLPGIHIGRCFVRRKNKRSFFAFPLTKISPNAVGDAAELENREQRDPWRDCPGSNSVTNGVLNIRQDEMDSRIKKGN